MEDPGMRRGLGNENITQVKDAHPRFHGQTSRASEDFRHLAQPLHSHHWDEKAKHVYRLSLNQKEVCDELGTIEGQWKELKGQVKEKWGKLTNDDLDVIAGKKDQLAGLLQKRYGYAKDKAEEEIDEFTNACSC